jgi:hypothetical protein
MSQHPKCNKEFNIKTIYLVNVNDVIFEGICIKRMKHKYGKFKRKVYKIDF